MKNITCFKASKELKGTYIYLSEDVSKATLDIRKQKLGALKEKRDQGLIAYFSGVEIISKPRNDRRSIVSPGTGANLIPLSVSHNQSQPESVTQSSVPVSRGAGTTNSCGASASGSSSNKQLNKWQVTQVIRAILWLRAYICYVCIPMYMKVYLCICVYLCTNLIIL